MRQFTIFFVSNIDKIVETYDPSFQNLKLQSFALREAINVGLGNFVNS